MERTERSSGDSATTASSDVTVLDHIDNIAVPRNPFREPANEYWALICLQQGMDYLYQRARHSEQMVNARINPIADKRFFGAHFIKLPQIRRPETLRRLSGDDRPRQLMQGR